MYQVFDGGILVSSFSFSPFRPDITKAQDLAQLKERSEAIAEIADTYAATMSVLEEMSTLISHMCVDTHQIRKQNATSRIRPTLVISS